MTKLYKYQKTGVKKIIRFKGRVLLADEMGLGKTIQALTYLRLRPERLPVLVVCPASAKWVWRNEIKKHTQFRRSIINGRSVRKGNPKDITIINYDILPYWKDILAGGEFKTLILDECHYIKSYKAKRTKAAVSLGKRIPHILALSGTPLTNRPKELYTTLHLLHPDKFKSFVPYAFRYCNRRMTPWGWDDNGASNLGELHEKLKSLCMIRRTKKEVLKDLPPKRRIVVPLDIERPNEYKQIEKDFIGWLEKVNPGMAQRAKQAETITKIAFLKRKAAELKLKAMLQWMDDFFEETDEKLLVFGWHRYFLNQLQNKYNNSCVKLDGSTLPKNREKMVSDFQKKNHIKLFLGQIKAAGTAITLTAASTVVMGELSFVPADHVQAEDRVHRIGQTNSVNIYYLIAKDTIEEKLCRILEKKFKVVTSVLDGEKHKTNEMDIYSQLIESYKNVHP